MGWADNKSTQVKPQQLFAGAGGTLTGNLPFSGGARIDCNNGNAVLHDRGCFELRAIQTSQSSLVLAVATTDCFRSTASTTTQRQGEKAYVPG